MMTLSLSGLIKFGNYIKIKLTSERKLKIKCSARWPVKEAYRPVTFLTSFHST